MERGPKKELGTSIWILSFSAIEIVGEFSTDANLPEEWKGGIFLSWSSDWWH